MELTERITSRVTELTGEVEALRKQLADAEHELERLEITGQVITQLTANDADAASEPGALADLGFTGLDPDPDDSVIITGYKPPEPARPPPPSDTRTRPCPPPAPQSSTASATSRTGGSSPGSAPVRVDELSGFGSGRGHHPAHL